MSSNVLVPTMGASLIGVFISTALYGLTSVQTMYYFQTYWTSDGRGMKSMVALLWILETLHTCLACAFIFRLLILNYANPEALQFTTASDDVTHGVLAAIIFLVHCFYIRRLWLFTKSAFLSLVVLALALCHFGFELAVMALIIKFPAFADFHRTTPYFTTATVCAAAADVLIAGVMGYQLYTKRKVSVKRTSSLVQKLGIYVISTGLITSVTDIVILGTFLGMPDNLVYLCFLNFVNNFYANSLLAMLNARHSLRTQDDGSGGANVNLSDFPNASGGPYTGSTDSNRRMAPKQMAWSAAIPLQPTRDMDAIPVPSKVDTYA